MENSFPRTVSLPSFDKHPAKESPEAVWDALPNPVLLKKENFLAGPNNKPRRRFLIQFGGFALAGLCIFVIVLFHGALFVEPEEAPSSNGHRLKRSAPFDTPSRPQYPKGDSAKTIETFETVKFNPKPEKYRSFPGSKDYVSNKKKYYSKYKKYGKPINFDSSEHYKS